MIEPKRESGGGRGRGSLKGGRAKCLLERGHLIDRT